MRTVKFVVLLFAFMVAAQSTMATSDSDSARKAESAGTRPADSSGILGRQSPLMLACTRTDLHNCRAARYLCRQFCYNLEITSKEAGAECKQECRSDYRDCLAVEGC